MRRWVVLLTLTALTSLLVTIPSTASPPADGGQACPWLDSGLPVEDRVRQLLGAMTLDEKLSMVHGSAGPLEFVGPVYAGLVPAIPRLCVPELGLSDGPAGVGNSHTGVTQLPAPLVLGATWDSRLAEAYGTVLAEEVAGKGAGVVLSPSVDLIRDPRAGRGFETFGEDPRLAGVLARAQIQAVQERGVLAQAKHLAAYNQETARNTRLGNAVVSQRALQEFYLPPFEQAVDAGVASVMCGYNQVNGVHACNNTYLISQVLKGQFGFDGFVTSDWFALHASHAAANAGVDMQMPSGCYFGPRLREGVRTGKVALSRLDDMVGRVLRQMFRHGLFDRPRTGSPDAVVTTPEHVAVARKVAEQGSVLLRNEADLLPFEGVDSIAVLGRAAGAGVIGSGGGSAHVIAPSIVTPFDGIKRRAEREGIDVRFAERADAAKAASATDVAVVFVSQWSSESKDHGGIALSHADNAMIEEVARANPNTVVVLNTGGPVTMPWLDDVKGVVAAWYPGQEYGNAIAALLFGDVNPAGKLPVTFPAALRQAPAADPLRFPGGHYEEDLAVGYRWYDQQGLRPLFPFGFGLSYTEFSYSDLRIGGQPDAATVAVEATVTNIGDRRGAEVAQLYVSHPAVDGEPPRLLKDFEKVELDPGRSVRVRFTLDERSLSHWDVDTHRWIRSAGDYVVSVGGSSRDLPLTGSLRVREAAATSEPTPPPPPGAPEGGDDALTKLANAATCPSEGVYAAALGAASLVGLPPGEQAETPPRNPSSGG